MCDKYKMTVIVITHNSALAPMADRVIHLKNGKVDQMFLNEHPQPIQEIEW
jgi:putative ABC transport system ATP-binding protein